MRKIETYGYIKDGALKISYRQMFDQLIKQAEDCRIRLVIEKLYKRRTSKRIDFDTGEETRAQNGFYWGVIIYEFCNGYFQTSGSTINKTEAHEFLKGRFNSKEIYNERTGEVVKIPQSTAILNTVEFSSYLEMCREFILDFFGINCPMPGEQTELELNTNIYKMERKTHPSFLRGWDVSDKR